MPTKEHIWPAGILRQKGAPNFALTPGGKRFYEGEPQIKDVCAECNNNKLSALDAYLVYSYANQFSKKIVFRQPTNFSYKYDLLLRSLLKIAYNSHRANNDKSQIALFGKIKGYILRGSSRPQADIRLQIVTESKVAIGGDEIIYSPDQFRSVMLNLEPNSPSKIISRLIVLNSYWFFVTVDPESAGRKSINEAVSRLEGSRNPSGITLSRSKNSIQIPWSKTTWMDPDLWGQNNLLGVERPEIKNS